MMEHYNNSKYYPSSFYAASKRSFETLIKYYKLKYPLLKIFNLKFYETFSDKDERNKIIPTIKKRFIKNTITKISSTKLSLNFLHVDDVINAIEIILTKKIIPGNYQIQAKKFTRIKDLIEKFNKKNVKKINCKFNNEKLFQINYNLKTLPYWRQKNLIEIKFDSIINGKN
jgi:dTDP-D-glucose 4,6-dehydratase